MADATYPPMRRKDRAITDPAQLQQLLARCPVMRLAMAGPDGPYVVPLNFGYIIQPEGRLQLFSTVPPKAGKFRCWKRTLRCALKWTATMD